MTDRNETVPGMGSNDPPSQGLSAEEEPVTTGTLFLTMIILMLIGGIWAIVYEILLER